MAALCGVLVLLVAAGSAVDMLRKRAIGQAKKHQGDHQPTSSLSSPSDLGGGGDAGRKWYMRKGALQSVLLCFSLPRNWGLLLAKGRGGKCMWGWGGGGWGGVSVSCLILLPDTYRTL